MILLCTCAQSLIARKHDDSVIGSFTARKSIVPEINGPKVSPKRSFQTVKLLNENRNCL